MTKLAIKLENQKPVLSIAHMASTNPFYYVEEAEIGHSKVTVAFFDENDHSSEIEKTTISTKDLIAFTNEFYRDYSYSDGEQLSKLGIEYLQENLKAVLTDYLNAKS